MKNRMTPLEVAALRKMVGLTNEGLAAAMKVNPRTIRSWESGRDIPSETACQALRDVAERHGEEVDRLLATVDAGRQIVLPRGPMPGGWYVALAARVMDAVPGASMRWKDDEDDLTA